MRGDPPDFGIGLDLGGTQIKGGLFDLRSGELLLRDAVPTRDSEVVEDQPAFLSQARALRAQLESAHGSSAELVGISSPGLVNREGTRVDFMPGRLQGLEGLLWSECLDTPARVVNDAHAALLGETWQGSASGLSQVVFLTLGTGVGGAVMVDGNLLRGHLGRAGHLGHISLNFQGEPDICNTPGSLEDLVGNHTIFSRSEGRFSSTHRLMEALEEGDLKAEAIWENSMRALAAGIASLVNVLDPEVVLIGGGISQAWDHIEPALNKWLDRYEWRPGGSRVSLRRAALGEWAGVYGAMAFALDQLGT